MGRLGVSLADVVNKNQTDMKLSVTPVAGVRTLLASARVALILAILSPISRQQHSLVRLLSKEISKSAGRRAIL